MARVIKARSLSAGGRAVDVYRDTVAPVVTDDASDDVIVGTVWELVDADGKLLKTYICTDPTAGAAVWLLLAEKDTGYRVGFIEEAVALTPSAGSNNLTNQLPAGAVPLIALLNYDTAIVLGTAVKIGLGTSGSIVGIGKTGTAVTKNTKNTLCNGALVGVPLAAATTLQLASVDTAGAAAGSFTSGTVRVRVFYQIYDALPDA